MNSVKLSTIYVCLSALPFLSPVSSVWNGASQILVRTSHLKCGLVLCLRVKIFNKLLSDGSASSLWIILEQQVFSLFFFFLTFRLVGLSPGSLLPFSLLVRGVVADVLQAQGCLSVPCG